MKNFLFIIKNPASSGPSELSDNTVYPIMHLVIRDSELYSAGEYQKTQLISNVVCRSPTKGEEFN